MTDIQNSEQPYAYLDRDGRAWSARPDGSIAFGNNGKIDKRDAEREWGPLVPLWPEGKAPQPDAYVWTKGDDEESLLARLVAGAHATVESGEVTISGPVTIDPEGAAWLANMRLSLHRWELANAVYMDRITVVPPLEPVLPEWVTYQGDGRLVMIAATSDGQVWWSTGDGGWLQRYGGEQRITAAELIARGGRLLIDHTGHAVKEWEK